MCTYVFVCKTKDTYIKIYVIKIVFKFILFIVYLSGVVSRTGPYIMYKLFVINL